MAKIDLQDAWKIINLSIGVNTDKRNLPSRKNGILQLLLSDANIAASRIKLGDLQVIKQGNGKVYKVSRTFNPRKGKSTENAEMQYCPTSGNTMTPISDVVEISEKTVSDPIEINDELMRCIQQSKAGYQSEYFNDYVRTHLNKLAVHVATVVSTKAGNFPVCDCNDTPDTCRDLPLFFSTVGFGVNPVGEAILQRDALEADLNMGFILVGGTLLSNYGRAHQLASGNQLGFDASLLDITQSVFYDPNLSTALGDPDRILAMAPGALQFITYNKHTGEFQRNSDTQNRVTVLDPYYGIEHDLLIYVDECEEEVKMFMQLATYWDVVGLPDCAFDDDCNMKGVKDVFCYTVVCADTKYCDIDPACGSTGNPASFDGFCSSAETCETFPIDLLVFDDANNNDVQDVGELGVANITVRVYADSGLTIPVAASLTDVDGIAAFNLPAGTYYVDLKPDDVTAAGHVINITLPFVLIVQNSGVPLYPGWFEDGKLPVGTAL